MSRKSKARISYIEPVVWIVGAILLWELLSDFWIPPYMLPAPSAVIRRLLELRMIWSNLLATVQEVLLGFFLGIAGGLTLALLISQSTHLERVFSPVLLFFQSVPKSALAPFFIVWLGFGELPKMAIVFLSTVFPLLVNTLSGLTITQAELLELMRQLRASKLQILMKIRLPNSLPFIFTGLKIAAPLSVIGAIAAEFVAGDFGLGYMIQAALLQIDAPMVFSCILLIAALGLGMFWAVVIAEKLLLPWYVKKE